MRWSIAMNALSNLTAPHRINTRAGRAALLGLTLLAAIGLSSCKVNPATGGVSMVSMGDKGEVELGREEHEKVLASQSIWDDAQLTAYVREVGNRIARVSDRPELEYTFTIIDSPEVNAFALPGGWIYVNRGLLTYCNSEAELAAVLAHEIGHVTALHHARRQARQNLSQAASTVGGFVTAVATGSGYIGSQISEIGSIYAAVGISGFGRELELEADELGAEYLHRAGYEPSAMINVITALKNREDFRRRVFGEQGGYHGVFSSHPRNDTRLQEAIAKVGRLDSSQALKVDDSVFRANMNGLVYGTSLQSQTRDERNRYYQELLGYTMVFPSGWTISETPTTVTATGPDGDSMTVEVQRLNANIEPRLFIRDNLGIPDLQQSEALEQYRLLGHTGTVSSITSSGPQRIAVIYMGPRAFIFRGQVANVSQAAQVDGMLLESVRSFRAIQRNELLPGDEMKIKYVQASEYFDFAVVAQSSRLAENAEESLRLLNGYWPTGNPEAGDWIKLIE